MSNREKFEAFLVSEYAWANDALNAAFFHGDDAAGYYIGGDYIHDGQSCSECLFWAWRGWQAASKASEQQLAAVVAENAGLKTYRPQPHGAAMMEALDAFFEHEDVPEQGMMASFEILCCKRPPTPATDAYLAEVLACAIPEGYTLIPQQIFLEPSEIESICSQCGDGHESGYGDFTDGLLWVGNIQRDDGSIVHGLHVSSADYTEEGGITICEFAAQLRQGAAL